MRKIAIITSKGGTGKTTTAINLGHGLALCGKRVLIIDCDAQRNIGIAFDVKAEKTLCDLLQYGDVDVVEVRKNLYMIDSGGRDLAELEMILAGQSKRERRLERALENLSGCDVVLCDCSPTINLININAITYAEEVIIPISMDYLAQAGARQTIQIIDEVNSYTNSGTQVMGILGTFYDGRTRLSKEVLETLRKHFPDTLLDTVIRINTSLREAPSFNRTIFEHSPMSRGAFDYYQLTEEFLRRG
ncbi:MAG: AAA family ATPase [Candidatus Latescibacteria bacterium]|nr:AAA family ATPase [Candidatus Latescibacterota bacterium]NIM21633.1 AAA family ATPase [Candidatus Latescibacterota bacterium]NIM64612.1 AAA family ATPase [Candidatus Latescibacterota bacterium]NIO01127.1 AAA family ATPase [Candidatus Latescibacterota bacterium]NIO27520.1 AAA family ATPase [Candidatus Latescibacterota bacterium]